METHTRSQFARDLKKYSAWGLKMLSHRHESIRIERLDTTNDDPSYRMSICKTLRKYCLLRIVICCNESFDSSRIVSNGQHLLHFILTIDFRSFHALRSWKVHVGIFSYHATHFYTLLTCAPLDFRYVNARFDFWHTMVISHIAYASRTPVC